jgi:hypothetical protein
MLIETVASFVASYPNNKVLAIAPHVDIGLERPKFEIIIPSTLSDLQSSSVDKILISSISLNNALVYAAKNFKM